MPAEHGKADPALMASLDGPEDFGRKKRPGESLMHDPMLVQADGMGQIQAGDDIGIGHGLGRRRRAAQQQNIRRCHDTELPEPVHGRLQAAREICSASGRNHSLHRR